MRDSTAVLAAYPLAWGRPNGWIGVPKRRLPNYRARRRAYRMACHDLAGYTRPKNDREWQFCYHFVAGAVKRAMANGNKINQKIIATARDEAVRKAGYREKRPRPVAERGRDMLELPRIQQGITTVFAELGVDVKKCGTVLAEILNSDLTSETTTLSDDGKRETVKSGVAAADKLKAVELFFKTTVGMAPTKSANLHQIDHRRDAFFDEHTFTSPPKPLLVEHEEK